MSIFQITHPATIAASAYDLSLEIQFFGYPGLNVRIRGAVKNFRPRQNRIHPIAEYMLAATIGSFGAECAFLGHARILTFLVS